MTVSTVATFRTKPELKKRVEELARLTNRPASYYYNVLLEDYLDDLEDIYLSEKVLIDVKKGNQKTYLAEDVFTEAGL